MNLEPLKWIKNSRFYSLLVALVKNITSDKRFFFFRGRVYIVNFPESDALSTNNLLQSQTAHQCQWIFIYFHVALFFHSLLKLSLLLLFRGDLQNNDSTISHCDTVLPTHPFCASSSLLISIFSYLSLLLLHSVNSAVLFQLIIQSFKHVLCMLQFLVLL